MNSNLKFRLKNTCLSLAALAIATALWLPSLHLFFREYTTFLSGTSANPDISWQTASVFGLIHLVVYVAFILLTPISLITAALLFAWNKSLCRPEIPQHECEVMDEGRANPRA